MFLSVGCIYGYYATIKLLTKHAACIAGSEPRVPAGGGLLPAKRRSHSRAQSSAYTRLATCPVPSLQPHCESGSSQIEPGRRKVNGKRIIIERPSDQARMFSHQNPGRPFRQQVDNPYINRPQLRELLEELFGRDWQPDIQVRWASDSNAAVLNPRADEK
jgi:hypothetical protein